MVLSFELWPLVEKYAGMWSVASELRVSFSRSGCGKSCFIHDDLQSDDMLPGPSRVTSPLAAADRSLRLEKCHSCTAPHSSQTPPCYPVYKYRGLWSPPVAAVLPLSCHCPYLTPLAKLALNSQSIKDYCGFAAEYIILSLYPQRTLDDNIAMTHNEIRGEIRQGLHHVVKGLARLKLSEFYSKCMQTPACVSFNALQAEFHWFLSKNRNLTKSLKGEKAMHSVRLSFVPCPSAGRNFSFLHFSIKLGWGTHHHFVLFYILCITWKNWCEKQTLEYALAWFWQVEEVLLVGLQPADPPALGLIWWPQVAHFCAHVSISYSICYVSW